MRDEAGEMSGPLGVLSKGRNAQGAWQVLDQPHTKCLWKQDLRAESFTWKP